MKIFIQSKSGDNNATIQYSSVRELMKLLRKAGMYTDDKGNIVPFEEIQFMREEAE